MKARNAFPILAIVLGLILSSHAAVAEPLADASGPVSCQRIDVTTDTWLQIDLSADRKRMVVRRGWHGQPEEYKANKVAGDGVTSVSYQTSTWLSQPMVLKLDVNEGDSFDYGDYKVGVKCSWPEAPNQNRY